MALGVLIIRSAHCPLRSAALLRTFRPTCGLCERVLVCACDSASHGPCAGSVDGFLGLAGLESRGYAWIPTAADGYNLAVEARSTGATAPEVVSAIGYGVTESTGAGAVMTGVTLSADMQGSQVFGTAVTWTAVGSGGSGSYESRAPQ